MADEKKGLGQMIKEWFGGRDKGQGRQGRGDGSGRREGYGQHQDGSGPQGGTPKCPSSCNDDKCDHKDDSREEKDEPARPVQEEKKDE